ncbi:hypothetical protein ACTPOK_23065 [Streptomyces inhibens]|uniref:hypothetical protein n=1 Tax=Streptomyces inhibens TaxID=2293571 RepID=UPI00402A7E20
MVNQTLTAVFADEEEKRACDRALRYGVTGGKDAAIASVLGGPPFGGRLSEDRPRFPSPARRTASRSPSWPAGSGVPVAPRLVQALGVALFWRPGHPDGYLTC